MDSRSLHKSLLELIHRHGEEKGYTIFLNYIEKNNLKNYLPLVLRHLKRSQEAKEGTALLEIISKYPLSQDDMKRIKDITSFDPQDELKEVHDEQFLGGFRALYKGYQYDGSLERSLEQFSNALMKIEI